MKSLYIFPIACLSFFFIGCGWREEITINTPPICKILDEKNHSHCTTLLCNNTSPLFGNNDFKNPSALLKKLRDAKDPSSADNTATDNKIKDANAMSYFLKGNICSKDLKTKIGDYKDADSVTLELLTALVEEFNHLLNKQIYQKDRFKAVSKAITNQFELNPQGCSLTWSNRLLLEDIYPDEIVKSHPPFDPASNFSEVPIEEGRPVTINLKVWLRWSGDDGLFGQCPAIKPGENKIKMYPGEIYSVVLFSGAKPLEGVKYEEAIERFGGSDRHVINTTLYSGAPVDNLSLTVGVYDQDQIAATQRDRISKFLDDAGKQTVAVYPPAAEVIPVVIPMLKLLFLDLPNLFLTDERLIPPSTWVIRKITRKETVNGTVVEKSVWRVEPSVRDFDYGIAQIELK